MEALRERFEAHGQGHVFKYWGELDEAQQSALLAQAEEIDLDELDHLVRTLVKGDSHEESVDFSALQPAPYESLPEDLGADERWQEAKAMGEEALKSGKVAAFTVAGGQGTRLGYDGPKGTYPVSPIKSKTLFQIFAEKVLAARLRYGCELPWYIMTSHINHEATESFFKENGFFGLSEGGVKFFKQGRMPAVDFEGKIVLENKDTIAMSPDGHGGALRALDRSGALAEMTDKGIEALSYFQVDNPLVQVIDPYFIGFHLQAESDMSSKMLPKAYEKEKLGHFCELEGKSVVVEYSDMPDELTAQRDEDGKLRFIAGSIAIHVVSVSFIRNLTAPGSDLSLPFHLAKKKIAYFSETEGIVKPSEPNGAKFEMFVFDALPFAKNPVIIEATRLGDFSPVKNAEGVDSPKTCEDDQQKLFAGWLNAQGVEIALDSNGVPISKLEVSPLFAYNSETFAEAWEASAKDTDFGSDAYLS
ncbi:MAG: UDPGP type 1 family protein [Verrucomicrobiota bacterium]